MSNLLIRWNTARILKGKLDKAKFLTRFSQFNQKYHEMYLELDTYIRNNFRDVTSQFGDNVFGLSKATYDDLVKHLDKVQEFQEYVAKSPTADEIRQMAGYLFGNEKLKDGMAVDPDIMKKMQLVVEYANGCGTLLNYIPQLCGPVGPITDELEFEVKQYLDYKGMLNFKTEEDLEMEAFQNMSPTLLTEIVDTANEILQDLTPHENAELQEEESEINQF